MASCRIEREKLWCVIWNLKMRILRWVGLAARIEEFRSAYRRLVGISKRKRLLGRQRRR